MWKILALAMLALFLDGSAYAGNTGQDTLDNKVVGITLAGSSWTQLATADPQRSKLLCQNAGPATVGMYIAPYANNNATPTPTGIGSPGVMTLLQYGSYLPDGGWIDGGELWFIGTVSTVITCYLSTSQP